MDQEHIIGKYIHRLLETGHPPASVYAFVKDLEISEREFFEQFASFEVLESHIWQRVATDTISSVEQGEEWAGFSSQQKLLTFYYALCDKILDQRSFFLVRFPRLPRGDRPSQSLCGMRRAFTDFAGQILDSGKENGEVACRGNLTKTYPLGLFGHLLSVIEFNMEDTSTGFERTDAYIEKSVRLAFDVMGTQAVDSAFDLFRFLSGRSWGPNDQS
ncbi:TetR family transcriptional regulator C-terminal domain-containing protein [Verrucomicrobiales bacterium]|nr:TetR family transcriptional regulator C-terminal domain-containing protein [Verrucomicrobiales bacterium]